MKHNDILLFSDLHAHAWSEFSELVPYKGSQINSRLLDALRVLKGVKKEVEEKDISTVIFAGDLFHRRRLLEVQVFNVVAEHIWKLARHCTVYLLAGNHDLVVRNSKEFTDDHALYALGRKHVKVIGEPTMILDHIGLVPYTADAKTLKVSANKLYKQGAKCLVMHAGVSGAVTGTVEFAPLEPVTVDELPDVPIYSGHYHQPQSLMSKGRKNEFRYLGAPLELVRGDSSWEKRGFTTVDVQEPYKSSLSAYFGPKFLKIDEKDLEKTKVKGNFVEIITHGVHKGTDLAKQTLERGARWAHVIQVLDTVQTSKRIKLKAKKGQLLPSIHELCDLYVDTANTDLDKTKLKILAKEALQEAEASSGV